MHPLLLELQEWDGATHDQRAAAARQAAAMLPSTFTWNGLQTFALGGEAHEMALFGHDGASFALLPGSSRAELGYNRGEPYPATPAQLADWQSVQHEFRCTLHEALDECLSPHRRVAIGPVLMETIARRFEYGCDGDDQTEGYERILSLLGDQFRLPTCDEWEYACAAGTRTLFRWGADCPVSNSHDDKVFLLHKQRNAFGLAFNSSTYDTELCHGAQLRGGDGGGAVHGGMGKVNTWFPLASAFHVSAEELAYWWMDDVVARRVRPLTQA